MNKDQLYLDRLTELGAEICKQHDWKVIQIIELGLNYDINVLGLNINKGSQIKIRLKNTNNEYYPWYELVGTLCHELAHNSIANHSQSFYKLMDQIHDDIEKLPRYEEIFAEMTGSYYSKGYTMIKSNITISNNTNSNNNEEKKSKYYITNNGTILDQSKVKNIKNIKPRTNKGRRKLILESLERRGLV